MPINNTAAAVLALVALSLFPTLHAQQAAQPAPEAGEPATAVPAQSPDAGVVTVPAPQEEPADLEREALRAYEAGEYLKFYIASLKLHNQMPFVPAYTIDLVRACALLGRTNTAYHYMLSMQQQGLFFDFNSTPDTESIRGTEAYDYINNMMLEAAKPTGEGEVAFEVAGTPDNFQALAWDGSRDRFLLGTADGQLLAVSEQGAVEQLLEAAGELGLWSIAGLGVDQARNRLWIAAPPVLLESAESLEERVPGALFEFTLDALELVGNYQPAADGLEHQLGKLDLTSDGHVYVADAGLPFVFVKRPGVDRLEPFVASRDMVAFTDIALAPDNSRVFAADPVKGILVIDPVAQQTALLSGPATLNLGGIYALEYHEGKLYVVQAGIQPQRVLRLRLDGSGAGVAESAPIAVGLEPFDRPGSSAQRGDALYYFANQGAAAGESLIVMKTSLDAAAAEGTTDVEDLKRMLSPAPAPASATDSAAGGG